MTKMFFRFIIGRHNKCVDTERRYWQKSSENSATFSPAPIPSLAEGAARRPVTTVVKLQKKQKEFSWKQSEK
jgi:hypothetical protein